MVHPFLVYNIPAADLEGQPQTHALIYIIHACIIIIMCMHYIAVKGVTNN